VWGKMLEDIPLRFVMTGAFFYLAVSIQGSIQSLMTVNIYIHFTQWVVAHAHLALLGGFGFIASGAILYIVPQIVRRPLWSRNLADAQYWLMLLGLMGFFWSITAAGLAQSSAWLNMGQQVVKSFQLLKPYFYLRSVFGAMILAGVIMQLVNLYMTVRVPAPDASARRRTAIADLEEIVDPVPNHRAVTASTGNAS
jgi:cbb3-type cytochrome oxidase subunit 1